MDQQEFDKGVAEALRLRNEGKHNEALKLLGEIGLEATGIQGGEVLHHMGTTLQGAKRFPEALGVLRTALRAREVEGDVIGVAFTQFQIAMCAWIYGKSDPHKVPFSAFRRAVPALEAALQARPTHKQEGDLRQNLAFCRQMTDDFAGALVDYRAVLVIRREVSDKRGEGLTFLRIGECCVRLGDRESASEAAGEAQFIFNPSAINDKARIEQLRQLWDEIRAMPQASATT